MKRKVVETSQEAYHSVSPEMLTDIYKRILDALKVLGNASGQQVATYLTVDDNKISRRMLELSRLNLVYNTGIKVPTKSGRNAYQWAINGNGSKENSVEHIYKKNEKSFVDYANKIIETANGQGYIQPELFK